jgi:hypothetical protein
MICLREKASSWPVTSREWPPPFDLREELLQRVARGDPPLSISVYPRMNGEHVVEIVGHASGEAPDGFHLVRVPQLLLERLPLLLRPLSLRKSRIHSINRTGAPFSSRSSSPTSWIHVPARRFPEDPVLPVEPAEFPGGGTGYAQHLLPLVGGDQIPHPSMSFG